MPEATGHLGKLPTAWDAATGLVRYTLALDGEPVAELNPLVGQALRLDFTGRIHCVHCGRRIRKTYGGGYCYPCFRGLARCDLCFVQPVRCHFSQGTCREPAWGLRHCFRPHLLYLARTSGIKVGITTGGHHLTRWMDQGAVEGVLLGSYASRRAAGQAEAHLAATMADATDWRRMLRGDTGGEALVPRAEAALAELSGELAPQEPLADPPSRLLYPVQATPASLTARKLDAHPALSGRLVGIKGQYLLFEGFVFNVRAHNGYEVTVGW